MKKKQQLIIGGGIVLLLLIVAGAYYAKSFGPQNRNRSPQMGTPQNQQGQPMGQQANQQVSESNPFKGGYQAAAELGIPMKCSYQDGEHQYQGFIKGKQFRGEIKMENNQMGYVIMKDDCVYTWSDETKGQGFKMCDLEETSMAMETESPMEDAAEETEETYNQPVNLPNNLTCYPANISDDEFAIPSDVEFTDFGQMMQGMGNRGEVRPQMMQ